MIICAIRHEADYLPFANDAVLFAYSPEALESLLNHLWDFHWRTDSARGLV